MGVTVQYVASSLNRFTFTGLDKLPLSCYITKFNDVAGPIIVMALKNRWRRRDALIYEARVSKETAKMCVYLLETTPLMTSTWNVVRDCLLAGNPFPVNLDNIIKMRDIWTLSTETPVEISNDGITCSVIFTQNDVGVIILKNHEVSLRLMNVKITRRLIFNLVENLNGVISGLSMSLPDNTEWITEYNDGYKTLYSKIGKIPKTVVSSILTGVPIDALEALSP